ncbi:hypothetical protein, partial [uncultured Methanofollis sp.]|uniref:hypothetical protein n=1 Tax=uncultured Methanofollis sp. TaxID=262500 RepID=UPI00262CA15B
EPTPEPTAEPTPEPTPEQPAEVLLITGYSYLNPGDKAMKDHLESKGYTVTTKEDDLVTAADAESKDVVIVSSSLNSGNVGATLKDAAVPVVSCEAWIYDDLKMTGTKVGTDFSAVAGQTQVAIADTANPLAAGLEGTVKVTGTAGYEMFGMPAAGAAKVATVVGQPDKVTVFAYDTDADMVGMKAPAPRVGFFLHDQVAASTTPEGWVLFDAAVKWAVEAGGSTGVTPTPEPTTEPTPEPTAEPTPEPTPEQPAEVLLIIGNSYLNPGDKAMKDHLESKGYTVTTKEDRLITAADAEGKDVVIFSSSMSSGSVGTMFRDLAVPVISCEAWLYDDLKMTGTSRGADYSAAAGQTQVAIADAANPLAAGLEGTVKVTGTAGSEMFGMPAAGAAKVATVVGQPDKVTIFAYDTDADMVGMKAPAPRVGFFLHDQVAASTTPEGWALFDAAVKWAIGKA